MKLSAAELDIIRQYFRHKPVRAAYLFGSYARQEATAQSDVDLLVELDYEKQIGLAFVGMKLDLEQALRKDVDLVSANAITERLWPRIRPDLTLIYERPH